MSAAAEKQAKHACRAMTCITMEVNVYSIPNCPMCNVAKAFLKANSISFIEHDVASDRQAAKDMIVKTGQKAVPVVEIDGEFIIGFDQDKMEELLGL